MKLADVCITVFWRIGEAVMLVLVIAFFCGYVVYMLLRLSVVAVVGIFRGFSNRTKVDAGSGRDGDPVERRDGES